MVKVQHGPGYIIAQDEWGISREETLNAEHFILL